jgi:hypothetical protein
MISSSTQVPGVSSLVKQAEGKGAYQLHRRRRLDLVGLRSRLSRSKGLQMEFIVSARFLIEPVPENVKMESEEVNEEEREGAMSGSVDDGPSR